MFTGIVQGMATTQSSADDDGIKRFVLRFPAGALDSVQVGASIAIDGVCLTVTRFDANEACFDCIEETLRLTTLGRLAKGVRVNFERSAKMGDEIGGHVLSGHIIGVAEVVERRCVGNNLDLYLKAPADLLRYIMTKGFIGIDGISLTIGEVRDGAFSLHLIPETLRVTTLGERAVGDRVNLEIDAMTQAVVHTVERVLADR